MLRQGAWLPACTGLGDSSSSLPAAAGLLWLEPSLRWPGEGCELTCSTFSFNIRLQCLLMQMVFPSSSHLDFFLFQLKLLKVKNLH